MHLDLEVQSGTNEQCPGDSADTLEEGVTSTSPVSLLILDLDNTLYDWVGYFVPSLDAMLKSASVILGTPEDVLRDSIRDVHAHYGNTEHPFALLEARVVTDATAHMTRTERFDHLRAAFEAFDAEKAAKLKLYDGVRETLETIRAAGATIVAHTDAASVSARSRVKILGLDAYISRVYATAFEGGSHPNPRTEGSSSVSDIVELGAGERKPNPAAVNKILDDYRCPPHRALYVGDNENKDLLMAHSAGVRGAWAEYGTHHDPALWARLLEFTHWRVSNTPTDDPSGQFIDNSRTTLAQFGDLVEIFTFQPL